MTIIALVIVLVLDILIVIIITTIIIIKLSTCTLKEGIFNTTDIAKL